MRALGLPAGWAPQYTGRGQRRSKQTAPGRGDPRTHLAYCACDSILDEGNFLLKYWSYTGQTSRMNMNLNIV